MESNTNKIFYITDVDAEKIPNVVAREIDKLCSVDTSQILTLTMSCKGKDYTVRRHFNRLTINIVDPVDIPWFDDESVHESATSSTIKRFEVVRSAEGITVSTELFIPSLPCSGADDDCIPEANNADDERLCIECGDFMGDSENICTCDECNSDAAYTCAAHGEQIAVNR